jgi:hypothetical protein
MFQSIWPESGGIAPPLLTSALNGSKWLVLRTRRFNPEKTAPDIYCIRCWVGPRAGLKVIK